MKKSPLSAPGGSGDSGCQGFRWKAHEKYSGTGYGQVKTDNYVGFVTSQDQGQASPGKGGEDFIPLGFSSPVSQQYRNNGFWRGPGGGCNRRNSIGGRFIQYRNSQQTNYQTSNKSRCNSPNSPYRCHPNQRLFQRKSTPKDAHRQVDVTNYVDLEAILEDPWSQLMKGIDKSQLHQGSENKNSVNASNSSYGSILTGDLTVKSNSSFLESDKLEIGKEESDELVS